jgi:hypothetical protein
VPGLRVGHVVSHLPDHPVTPGVLPIKMHTGCGVLIKQPIYMQARVGKGPLCCVDRHARGGVSIDGD